MNCPKGYYQVSGHYRKAYIKQNGTRVSSTTVKPHCRKNPKGYKRWHYSLSNKRPQNWRNKYDKSKKWTTTEVEAFIKAYNKLPRFLTKQGLKFHRMKGSLHLNNPASRNEKNVALYDLAFSDSHSLESIIAHEFAHGEYKELTGDEKEVFSKNSQTQIKEDDHISEEEKFANHLEEFLTNPKKLKRSTPKAYKWLSNKYTRKRQK